MPNLPIIMDPDLRTWVSMHLQNGVSLIQALGLGYRQRRREALDCDWDPNRQHPYGQSVADAYTQACSGKTFVAPEKVPGGLPC